MTQGRKIRKRAYKKRSPKKSVFRRMLSDHFEEFLTLYPERFRKKYGFLRRVIPEAVSKYLECGDFSCGFARIKCKSCKEEYLLAFSCKMRYFCPSCHQKRILILGEFLKECVLSPVAHR